MGNVLNLKSMYGHNPHLTRDWLTTWAQEAR